MSGQCQKVLALLRSEPSVSSLDIIHRLSIVNTTARISELRQAGHDIRVRRDRDGVFRFRLVEPHGTLGL